MKPSKLRRHLESNHPSYVNKPNKYSERLLKFEHISQRYFKKFPTATEKYFLVSYTVSYLIAEKQAIQHRRRSSITFAAFEMVEILHGRKYGDGIRKIGKRNCP